MEKKSTKGIQASHFGKSHKDLLNSFVENNTSDPIARMQDHTNRTLKALIQKKRSSSDDILSNNIKLKDTNKKTFGIIDEISKANGIGKIKTVSAVDFEKIMMKPQSAPHFGELNALMHNSKIKKGYIHYVNEDNPFVQKTVRFKYDMDKYTSDLSKVKRVQSFMEKKGFNLGSEVSKDISLSTKDFSSNFMNLQEAKSQSIVQAGLSSNNPFLRNMTRESRPIIEGMQHGWFGKMRRFATAFGSPFRLGDYGSIASLTDNDISDIFDDQYGLDIETLSLQSNKASTFQVGMKKGKSYEGVFIKQNPGFKLSDNEFLSKTAIGKINANTPIDFTKAQSVPNYAEERLGKNVEIKIMERLQAKERVQNFFDEAKSQKKNIFAHNANFEIDHLSYLTGDNQTVNYSQEYREVRRKINKSNKTIMSNLTLGKISEDEAFSQIVANQKLKFSHIMGEATEKSGKLLDVREISRTLNAVAQEKGLIPKTGKFGLGTNVEFLSKTFLKETEWHEGLVDAEQQNTLAKKLTTFIRDIEGGKVTKETLGSLPEEQRAFINTWNTDLQAIHKDSLVKSIKSEIQSGGNFRNLDPKYQTKLFSNSPVNDEQLFKTAMAEVHADKTFGSILSSNKAIGGSEDILKKVRVGSLLLGGILLGSAVTNLFKFSGRDDDANTIEGLRHGPVQSQRQNNTAFGSGYQMQKFHNDGTSNQDPEESQWGSLATTGIGVGGYLAFKNKKTGKNLNDLTYLGALSGSTDNERLLGRKEATVQDTLVSGIRRFEASAGGFPRAFGLGDILSYGMYDSAEFTVDLTTEAGESYARYMDKILTRKISAEGITSITFNKGELFLNKDQKVEKIAGKFSLMKTVTDYNQNTKVSSLAKSQLYVNGITRLDDMAQNPFLIIGGKQDLHAVRDFANAFAHESLSKPLKLLADPLEGLRDLIPDVDSHLPKWAKRLLSNKYIPNVGLDGKELVDTVPGLLKNHGIKLAGVGAALYYGLGTLNWGAQQIGPDGTPMGDAGLLGVGASALRFAHEAYARASDITGFTTLRNKVEELAPGMGGWQSTIGLSLSGAMFGGLYATLQDVAKEGSARDKYAQFLQNTKKTEKFEGALGKIFTGEMTNVAKKAKIGGLVGFALALPFTIAGIGADKSAAELDDEYSGRKEVAVRKGRFWESSFTPWEGGEIDYYRPSWYVKLMDDAKSKTLDTEGMSPLGETLRGLMDPYWLEKRRYNDQPYPVTGPDGSALGIFGSAYESTIGRVLKPVALMHEDALPDALKNNTEYDLDAQLRKQWNSTLEFMGLRGFVAKTIKADLTGSPEIFADPNEARSAKDIDSVVRDFYDLQIGGGILTSEALRRVFQAGDSFQKAQLTAGENLNPLKNNMPSWMPGSDYYQDFQHGDPFLKVKDGYYRLPGAGFASRYEDLQGVDPEEYSDIYKYKILSDVAYGSMQHRTIKGKLQNRELTEFEQKIFDEVQRQVDEKNESKVNVRDPSTYDSFLGRYSAMVTDLARSNPLETLLPFSPAHKFLGPPDVEDYMEEQRFSKEYRNWANPIDDFIMPTVSMGLNNLGIGGIDLNADQAEADTYFDKVNYVKYSNLARDAQGKGDLKTADQYTIMAQKTYSGADVFSHHAEVAKTLPKSERNNFNFFVKADSRTQEKMLNKVSPHYRDAYEAQMYKQQRESIAQDRQLRAHQKQKRMSDIAKKEAQLQARRNAKRQDARSSKMPTKDWKGWNANVNTINTQNKARDYHGYSPRTLREDPMESIAAQGVNVSQNTSIDYASHYADLNSSGIEDALVVIRPGLDDNSSINIKVDRTDERNEMLREWGYVV